MRTVAASALSALVVAATVGAEPQPCEPARALDAFTVLVERDWWQLSPSELDALWPHRLRDTGCGTEEGRCLDRTWCGRSSDRPDECVCSDQFSFTGPAGRLTLAYLDVTVEVDPDDARDAALRLGDALEATGRAVSVECGGVRKGAALCHEWPAESAGLPAGQVVATSIWLKAVVRGTELSAEAYVLARESPEEPAAAAQP